jgi:hypothetical protein
MSLADIVAVTITATTAAPTREGFGTPLIASYHSEWVGRVREYTSLAGLVSDGFATDSATYLIAAAVLAQNPKVKSFKVGRRALAPTHIVELAVNDATEGLVYSGKINGVAFSYTVPAAQSTTQVATALEAVIDPLGTWTSVPSTNKVTVTSATPGERLVFSELNRELGYRDATTDPGLATDLNAILLADSSWYGLLIDGNSEAEIAAAALWTETQKKIFVATTSDTLVKDAGSTTDIGADLDTAAYARTGLIYSESPYAGAALLGDRLPDDPGTDTWAFKTLATIPYSNLNPTEVAALDAKHVNHYTRIAGINITRKGWSSAGEYMDITRSIDWLSARIQERIYAILVNSRKLPYTDRGVDVIRAEIMAQLDIAIGLGMLAATPAPTVTAPKVADVDPIDRANRLLPDVTFTAQLAGAIHQLEITGTLQV